MCSCARLRTGTPTELTLHQRRNADLNVLSGYRLLKGEAQVIAQIGAPVHPAPTASTTTENIAEDVTEDVGEAPGNVTGSGAKPSAGLYPRMPELIIRGSLLRIVKHLVGSLGVLEPLLCLRPGIAIRMVLHREAPVGLFDIGLAGVSANPKKLVVVAFGHSLLRVVSRQRAVDGD